MKKISKINLLALFLILSVLFLSFYFFNKKDQKKETVFSVPEQVKDSEKGLVMGNDLLGSAKLSYAGGTEGRRKNIEIGISRIDGTIIKPGEEFSFKKALGNVSAEDGFSEERVFLNGEVTKGIGGGLCQVSTLVFRAAMSSALPITERKGHTYTVSYYDYGLDATYSDPGPDFKFKNDTENPIVIKGKTENLNAIFEIYGINDGRVASTSEVTISDIRDILPTKYIWVPELKEDQSKCINNPQIGYTAKIQYEILYADGRKGEQEFISKYKPLQKVCYIVGDEIKTFDFKNIYK